MRFFCIVRSLDDRKFPKKTFGFLKDACEKRGVEFIVLESDKADFTELPKVTKGDMVYRITIDEKSDTLYNHLLTPEVSSFLLDNMKRGYSTNSWSCSITHRILGLPVIPTVVDLPKDRKILDKYVKYLGGYPIVVKVEGGSHGVGVMRADSSDSLYSIVDYLRASKADAALRKYIDFESHARLVVLGDKVIDSIEYRRPDKDFRSNAGKMPNVVPRQFSPEIEETAVKATKVLGYDFGGVDILIDKDGGHFLAEVNFPCNFSRCQELTGVDIAGMMIDHLIAKVEEAGSE